MPPDDPYEEFLVAPRHLAGTYDPSPALRPLRNLDWHHRADTQGNVFFTSPCDRVEVAFAPEGPTDDLWTITAHKTPGSLIPAWQATFDSRVPEELVLGVTEAIAADPPTTSQRHPRILDGPGDDLHTVHSHFTEAGWTTELALPHGTVNWTAPDELAGLLRRSPATLPDNLVQEIEHGAEAWLFWGGVEDTLGQWQAAFTSRTPIHLVAGFAAALTNPAPVIRNQVTLPQAHQPHVTTRPVPTWPPADPPPPHQLRAQAATARSTSHAPDSANGQAANPPAGRPSPALPPPRNPPHR